jgi:hypothetical protein
MACEAAKDAGISLTASHNRYYSTQNAEACNMGDPQARAQLGQ